MNFIAIILFFLKIIILIYKLYIHEYVKIEFISELKLLGSLLNKCLLMFPVDSSKRPIYGRI